MLKAIYRWMESCVHKRYATALLIVLFYLEALLFILPTDPMLIIYCLEQRKKAFWYAFLATCSSVLGGITGYIIGYIIWQHAGQAIIHHQWINLILTPENFYYLCDLYKDHAYFAIFIAGFTPVPYKAATLTAGFCSLSFVPFVVCSFLARGARFFLYAILITIWGEQIKKFIDRYFNLLVILIIVLITLALWLCKH